MTIEDLPTPALLLEAELFEANIRRMAEHAAKAEKLRPHAKRTSASTSQSARCRRGPQAFASLP